MIDFALTTDGLRAHLEALARDDAHVAKAVALVGYPEERRRGNDFATFIRVIVGQQLSTKAAATIAARVETLVGLPVTPEGVASVPDDALRAAGLSWQKITYVRSLTAMVQSGELKLDALPGQPDEAVVKSITAIKGFGVWSAHMYLMFSLGRTDIWPVGDLAVRVGVGRIVGLADRPTEKQVEALGERWRPYRSAMAMLAWHYYANAPL